MIRSFNKSLPLNLLPPRTGDNNVDMARLLEFVTQLYHPHVDDSFCTQLYISMSIVLFLLIPGCTVILHRLFQGRLWFVKIWHVAGGTFIIPNAVIAFLSCQAGFALCWISYVLVSVQYFHRNQAVQKNFFLWRILIWTPLWLGGWWSAFGVLSAFPDALTCESKKGGPKRLILSHSAFNVACWCVPLVHFSTILPLALISARTYNKTLEDFDAWRQVVDVAEKGKISDAAFTVLNSRALELWLDVTKAYWYYGIAMTCWSCWAALCLVAHVPLGAHTLSRIRSQLQLAKRKEKGPSAFFRSQPPVIRIEEPTIQERSVQGSKDEMHSTAVQTRMLGKDQQQSGLALESKDRDARESSPHCSDLLEVEQRGDGLGSSNSRVFPPMKMPPVSLPLRPSRVRTPEQRRIHSLERVYRNISIQYCGICIAILCFFGAALIPTAQCYDSARNNTIGAGQVVIVLSAAYPITIFGFLIVFCIFWCSFDPALSIDVTDDESHFFPARSTLERFTKRALQRCKLAGKMVTECQDTVLTICDDSLEHDSFPSQHRLDSTKELESAFSGHTAFSTTDRFSVKREGSQCEGPVSPKRRRGISSLPASLIDTEKLARSATIEKPVLPVPLDHIGAIEPAPATVVQEARRVLSVATLDNAGCSVGSGAQAELGEGLDEQRNEDGVFENNRVSDLSRASSFKQTQRAGSMISISSANTFAAGQRRSHASRPESPTLTDGIESSSRPESFGETAASVSTTSNRSFSFDLEQGLQQYCEHAEQAALPRLSFGIDSVSSPSRRGLSSDAT